MRQALERMFEVAFWAGVVVAIVMLFGAMLILLSGIMVIWLGF
jgi:hypothetical protein